MIELNYWRYENNKNYGNRLAHNMFKVIDSEEKLVETEFYISDEVTFEQRLKIWG